MLNTTEVDPDCVTIPRLAKAGMPIALPWLKETVLPGTMFYSARCHSVNPWGIESPFEDLDKMRLVARKEDGTHCTYYSAETRTKVNSLDHMSLSLGVQAGCSFLNANVSGQYDKDVMANSDDLKKSTKTRCSYGTVYMETPPKLTKSALATIKHIGGFQAFKERYGDYYVAGYRLGAESGMMLSEAAFSTKTAERLSLTVKVKILFIKVSKTWEQFFSQASANSVFTICGYDTLSHSNINYSAAAAIPGDFADIRSIAGQYESYGQDLGSRVENTMLQLGVNAEAYLQFKNCEDLCNSGLVVEVLLRPVQTLREFQFWATNDNII